ncbi:MAG: response regulator [Candidatus Omnitrophota bacterium]
MENNPVKKILVADDDVNIVQLIASRLKREKYNVIAAYDGMQAVNIAHEQRPDLIILDIKMPAGGGMSVYDDLKMSSHTALIPVVFITAYSSSEIKEKVLNMGARDFIAKPFNSEDLLLKVERALK